MAIATTYITTLTSPTDAGSYNFGNITVPGGGGLVVCVVNSAAAAGRTISAVSMGGSAGTSAIATPSSTRPAAIFYRVLSAGSNNITVSIGGGSAARCTCACYMLTGYQSATPTDTDYVDVTAATSAALTMDYASGGGTGLFGILKVTDEDISWSGATEDRDAFDENSRVAFATRVASGTGVSSTASWTTANNATIIGATWEAAPTGGGNSRYYRQQQSLAV